MIAITGKDNKVLKTVRSLQRKKGREETGLYFVEGVRMVQEAMEWAKDSLQYFLVSETYAEKNPSVVQTLETWEKPAYLLRDNLFRELCNTEAPQGLGAVLTAKSLTETVSLEDSFVLILDGVSEPGNMGTIIRTAEAAGVDRVLLMKGCVDLYNPKVVRSTMGSLFRVPCVSGVSDTDIRDIKHNGFTVIATALHDAVSIENAKVDGKRALVIGSEAFGVSKEILDLSDIRVYIPMSGQVESLNAGVAAGISMYMLKGDIHGR